MILATLFRPYTHGFSYIQGNDDYLELGLHSHKSFVFWTGLKPSPNP